MKKKIALIFGITGQDGSYLADFLIKKVILYMELKEDHPHLIQVELTIFIKIHMKKKECSFCIMET